jgi:hypothetical protein
VLAGAAIDAGKQHPAAHAPGEVAGSWPALADHGKMGCHRRKLVDEPPMQSSGFEHTDRP